MNKIKNKDKINITFIISIIITIIVDSILVYIYFIKKSKKKK